MPETPKPISTTRWIGGASDYLKESSNGQIASTFYFSRSINFRDDPQSITLLPGAIKESGAVITDLLKWGDITPESLTTFYYGSTGFLYSRTNAGTWTALHQAAGSHGNGLAYFAGDDYIYYSTDTGIGRYGTIASGSPQFVDNFLQSQGGVPTNTASVLLVAASTQYAHAADSGSLEVTGDLTLETFFYANSLPAAGASMTLLGKWDESGATRSYIMDLFGVSGYFGSGVDGSLTISVNTTEAPIDSACTGTAGTQALTATNAAFAAGQVILVHQSSGTNAGQQERILIQSYTAGTITTATNLIGTYVVGAQVRVLKQYTSVTVNTGITYLSKAWNGTTGGILAFLANGTVSYAGAISVAGCGYMGAGDGISSIFHVASQGEGRFGIGTDAGSPNDIGGGGGIGFGTAAPGAGGGGGSNATVGTDGGTRGGGMVGGTGAVTIAGSSDLTTAVFGGGGGAGGATNSEGSNVSGNGGGFMFIAGATITQSGTGALLANGAAGAMQTNAGSTGGGAGGSILLKAQTATLGTTTSAIGGIGGISTNGTNGGNGGVGYVVLDYLTANTGTSLPTLNAIQDPTLVTTPSTQARLGISSNGTAAERLTQVIPNLTTGVWNRLSISWVASTGIASFYLNGVLLGTSTGALTAISSNASLLYVGANKGASTIGNYFDGLLNDTRVWSQATDGGTIFANNLQHIPINSVNLQAYYYFNGDLTDQTANNNNLTGVNTPTFSPNVPFPAPTTRLDIDQENITSTSNTYTLLGGILETAANMLAFTPTQDPQKSVAFNINAPGTGNWTVTVHDQQNRVIVSVTVPNAQIMATGYQEFVFPTPWRIVIGKTYHLHLTVSTGTSKVFSITSSNFSTANFVTYYQFLVTDTQFHPITDFLNFIVVGNERYLAKWDGAFYQPNLIAFPPQWKVRCFSYWREYLAIGVWRGGSISAYDEGRIYFWDGISLTFNFYIDVPEGQINAMFGVDSDLYFFAGYRAQLLDYAGGYFYNTGNSKSNKLKFIPQRAPADVFEIYPGALTMWRGILHFGIAANSISSTVFRGTYSYGTYNQMYPEALSFDYPLSTGNTGSTVSIGLTYPVGQNLIIGWQDGIAFGADVVNFNNPPATSGELDLLVQDLGAVWKEKGNFKVRADYLPLNSGESVDTKIKIDRNPMWTTSPIDATVGDTKTEFPFLAGRGREFEIGVDLYATGSTSPTLIGLAVLNQKNIDEQSM